MRGAATASCTCGSWSGSTLWALCAWALPSSSCLASSQPCCCSAQVPRRRKRKNTTRGTSSMRRWSEQAVSWLCRVGHGGNTFGKWCFKPPRLFVSSECNNACKVTSLLLSSHFKQGSAAFMIGQWWWMPTVVNESDLVAVCSTYCCWILMSQDTIHSSSCAPFSKLCEACLLSTVCSVVCACVYMRT